MGLPMDALVTAANQQLGAEFIDAPMRLQAESYASFAQRLHSSLRQDGEVQASVEEELRRLQIDPEVFYGNAQRLGVREYSADDLDPTSGAGRSSEQMSLAPPTHATLAALLASSYGDSPEEALAAVELPVERGAGESCGSFEPPPRGGYATTDALRVKEIESYHIGTEADNACRLGMCGLNMPNSTAVEEPVCEEIMLDDAEEETRGGRLSCETPQGLQAKLQIDSLTDDEDEEVFQTGPAEGSREADGEDQIEAFSLDPDFDYDTVANLSRRY